MRLPPAATRSATTGGPGRRGETLDEIAAAKPLDAPRAVLFWSRLHGLMSLEIAGNFAFMGIDPDQVFEIELAALTA